MEPTERVEDLVQAVHRLDDASGGQHARDAMALIAHLRDAPRTLAQEVLDDATLVDDWDGYYGYLISPSLIDKLKEVVNDAGT